VFYRNPNPAPTYGSQIEELQKTLTPVADDNVSGS
jgi:hypothetical protein